MKVEERRQAARRSLEGLSVGDAFGERFFVHPWRVDALIEHRSLPQAPWAYTDDTVMALSIVELLEELGEIRQDELARRFARRYAAEPRRGYGGKAHDILSAFGRGEPWSLVARSAFGGEGSMGNGAAMRVAPLGAYFSDDLARVVREARASAEVTHAHPDGQAGAIAVAVAAAVAASPSRWTPKELWSVVLAHTPPGPTRDGIARARSYPLTRSPEDAAAELGSGARVISADTVPFSLWCAARHHDSYEEALWATVAGLGDRDTTCAIVGSLVALSDREAGIPAEWRAAREALSWVPVVAG